VLEDRDCPSTFTVNSIADSGPGSLRDAITQANANVGLDTINFNILGSGVQTIALLSALPTITDPVFIDGYSQPGSTPNTLAVGDNAVLQIELSGASAGSGANGLVINAGNCTVQGLVINRFAGDAIQVSSGGGNIIQGNFIGTNPAGTTKLGNGGLGSIEVYSAGNRIGTDGDGVNDPGERNLIAGGGHFGIFISTGGNNNLVAGNYIGTDATGTQALGNTWEAIDLALGAQNNIIGTDGFEPASVMRNVMAANLGGVKMESPGTSFNRVAGNYIGTDVTGTKPLSNIRHGFWLLNGASSNIIGTNSDGTGDATEGNLIAGNGAHGVLITDIGSNNNVVAGNHVGTDVTGMNKLSNGADGIVIVGGAAGNIVGGTTAGAGNLISGNGWIGVQMDGVGTSNNAVLGNTIGLNAAGTAAIANGNDGVAFSGGASNNTVGGITTAARNVISGNGWEGVEINGAGTSNNIVLGNYIGTNPAGTAALANALDGIGIDAGASSNTIGGTSPAARNLISGNARFGVVLVGTGSSNAVQGNYIGTNVVGTAAIANGSDGVLIGNYGGGPTGNIVGGTAAGAGNLISGNGWIGVQMDGAGTANNAVLGNTIGLNAAGTAAMPNGNDGVAITNGAACNTVGGTTIAARNIISGNGWIGVEFAGSGSSNNVVLGNYIGTNPAGTAALANSLDGVAIGTGDSNNTIGGTAAGARNIISGNNRFGLYIYGSGTTGNSVAGNYIGTDVTGAAPLGNGSIGIEITSGAAQNTVGGNVASARNVISANASTGVDIETGSNGNVIEGNLIGTTVAGNAALGNGVYGVTIGNGSNNNTVGGASSIDAGTGNLSGAGNVISANGRSGVGIFFGAGNIVQGNFIGTNITGTAALGNVQDAVLVSAGSTANIVGGTSLAFRNLLSGNGNRGVDISAGSNANLIQGNYIGTDITGNVAIHNAGAGIGFASASNTIGGTTPGAANLISGNGTYGIRLDTASATANLIEGNDIGTNAAGTVAIPNAIYGIFINGGVSNTIGGTVAGAGNVISGNASDGINVAGPNNLIEGNIVGVMVANGGNGVTILSSGNTIGGSATGAGNVIGVNTGSGIKIIGAGATGNVIQGNFIGTNSTGIPALGNLGNGVLLGGGASNNTIGGIAAGAGNVIAFNGAAGVAVQDATSTGNAIRGNSIHANAGLGIDLGGDGVTANDPGDPDTGPNQLQNYPVLSAAAVVGGSTTVAGSLNSTPFATFTLDFYANSTADPSGFGPGERYLGSTTLTTDASGNACFSVTLSAAANPGDSITATATDAAGNTSEFSAELGLGLCAVLNIDALGNLSYTASAGVANHLTLGLSGGTYSFTETGEPILVVGAGALGCSGSGTNTVTCPLADVQSLLIDVGDQNDTVRVLSLGNPATIIGGTGNDVITVGDPSLIGLAGIQILTVVGGGGNDSLLLDNTAYTGPSSFTITSTAFTFTGVNAVYNYGGLTQLTLNTGGSGGAAGSTVFVTSTPQGTNTTINGGPGNDTITAGNPSDPQGLGSIPELTVNGGGGNDTLFLDNTGFAGSTTFVISSSAVSTGSGVYNYLGLTGLALDTGGSVAAGSIVSVASTAAGTFTTINGGPGPDTLGGPNTVNTWAISDADTGNLNGVVAFSSVENMTGGTGADTFLFSNGKGVTGKIDGAAGVNTLDYSAYTTSVVVNLAAGTATGAAAGVSNIAKVTGGSGDDILIGDAFANVLIGNAGNNILVGGAGNDTLIGGPGRDLLIGGLGSDQLDGGAGDDILIGGTTNYDTNIAALQAIMKEWSRTDLNYHQRINDLLNGGGLNGSIVLVNGSTVLDDNAIDTLTGGAGMDWFFLNKKQDIIIDWVPGERQN
jgi:hypothetical protein